MRLLPILGWLRKGFSLAGWASLEERASIQVTAKQQTSECEGQEGSHAKLFHFSTSDTGLGKIRF